MDKLEKNIVDKYIISTSDKVSLHVGVQWFTIADDLEDSEHVDFHVRMLAKALSKIVTDMNSIGLR